MSRRSGAYYSALNRNKYLLIEEVYVDHSGVGRIFLKK